MLRIFFAVSGLSINLAKSSFVPINVRQEDLRRIKEILGCQQTQFLVTYLGMPLTAYQLSRAHFMPIAKKVEKNLNDWKGKLILRGRLQLVKSVISSVPIYHMACFRIPQWAINKIYKIRRTFYGGNRVLTMIAMGYHWSTGQQFACQQGGWGWGGIVSIWTVFSPIIVNVREG